MHARTHNTRTPHTRLCRAALAAFVALLIAGCGDEYPLAPVSGTITLNGKPLADAHVSFEPMGKGKDLKAGPGSYCRTDQDGRFTLKTLHGDDGAVVGEHRVLIRAIRAGTNRNGQFLVGRPEIVPARYNSKSELTFDVPSDGTDAADFRLTSP